MDVGDDRDPHGRAHWRAATIAVVAAGSGALAACAALARRTGAAATCSLPDARSDARYFTRRASIDRSRALRAIRLRIDLVVVAPHDDRRRSRSTRGGRRGSRASTGRARSAPAMLARRWSVLSSCGSSTVPFGIADALVGGAGTGIDEGRTSTSSVGQWSTLGVAVACVLASQVAGAHGARAVVPAALVDRRGRRCSSRSRSLLQRRASVPRSPATRSAARRELTCGRTIADARTPGGQSTIRVDARR